MTVVILDQGMNCIIKVYIFSIFERVFKAQKKCIKDNITFNALWLKFFALGFELLALHDLFDWSFLINFQSNI